MEKNESSVSQLPRPKGPLNASPWPRLVAVVLPFCLLELFFLNIINAGNRKLVKTGPPLHQSLLPAGSAGALDNTFGTGGKVTTDFGGNRDEAFALTVQADGKIIAIGSAIVSSSQQSDFALARYNSDGSLDAGFGTGGKVTTDFGGDDQAGAVAIQPDGKIVVAGCTCSNSGLGCTVLTGSGYDYALARYHPNGSLDTSFGSGGKVTTDFNGGLDVATSVVVEADGKIIAGGTSCSDPSMMCMFTGGTQFSLARYNADGSLDHSFGHQGKVFTPVPTFGSIRAMALQPDGKLVAAGIAHPGPTGDFALARYNSDGTLDSSFGQGGLVTTDFNSSPGNPRSDQATGLAIQADGKIVVVGGSEKDSELFFDFSLARYNRDGTLDNTFGSGGKVQTALSSQDDMATSVVIESDGKILAGGIAGGFLTYYSDGLLIVDDGTATGSDLGLVRYNSDGTLDTTFGEGGIVTTDFFGFDDGARFALQPDGLVVAAGMARHQKSSATDLAIHPRRRGRTFIALVASVIDTQSDADFALARYETAVQPDFSMTLAQPTISTPAGKKVTATVDFTRIAGLKGAITVTPPAPPNKTIKIPQAAVSTSGNQVSFSIKVKASARQATYPLVFTGKDKQGQTHMATLTLMVE
jgi:uncharacterized delta-60 repeat protein